MAIMVGSARMGENGRITGGAKGDQKQISSSFDTKGEVSMQNFYIHSKGWYILRPIDTVHASAIANNMFRACNNPCLGYNQNDRYGVVKLGIQTKTKTNCDCSSLVRACVKEATGKDPGDFNTSSECSALVNTGLFTKISFINQSTTPVYDGDVLVTKTKGHTVVVVSGNPRSKSKTSVQQPKATTAAKYSKKQFIKDVQAAIGAKVDGIAGPETLSKTVTISKSKNNRHAVVKPIQRYFNYLGYLCGTEDGIAGAKFDASVKAYQKAKNCVVDGEITAAKNTWKSLLGLR